MAIYKRDFLSYFRTMSGYVFLAGIFLVCGYCFTLNNITEGSGSLLYMYNTLGIVMTVAVPFMTARVFLDGREINTEQLLYVSSLKAIALKFAAVMSFFAAGILSTWVFTGILSICGRPFISETVLMQAGLLLLCACVASLTMFIVSIAHRKTQAFVMIYTIIMVFFIAHNLIKLGTDAFYEQVFWMLSLFRQYSYFQNGILSPGSVIYMLAFTGIFLLLAGIMLERKREKGF